MSLIPLNIFFKISSFFLCSVRESLCYRLFSLSVVFSLPWRDLLSGERHSLHGVCVVVVVYSEKRERLTNHTRQKNTNCVQLQEVRLEILVKSPFSTEFTDLEKIERV